MADETVEQTGARQGFGQFLIALKRINPNVTDVDAAEYYDAINEAKGDPSKIELANQTLSNKTGAAGQIANPQIADPYAGTGYSSKDLVKQFNPEQLRAAQRAQSEGWNKNAGARYAMNAMAAMASPERTADIVKAMQDRYDAQNKLETIGAEDALEKRATAGLTAGKSVQEQLETSEKIRQAKQKTDTGQFDLEFQRKLNDPTGPLAELVRKTLDNQAALDPTLAKDPKFKAAMSNPKLTPKELLMWAKPGVLDSLKEKAGIASTQATTANQDIKNRNMIMQAKDFYRQQGKTYDPFPDYNDDGTPKNAVKTTTAQPSAAPTTTPATTTGYGDQKGTDPSTGYAIGTNNVGNIKDPKTGQFRTFATPAEGYRALQEDLLGKIKKGFNSVESMITRYAPPSENDTASYIKEVAAAAGIDPKAPIAANDAATLQKIAAAIIKREGNTKITQMPAEQKDVARLQRQGGTVPTPSSITPATVGAPIKAAINSDNTDLDYIAKADPATLNATQQLMRKRMESTDPSEIVALDRQIAQATGKPYTPAGAGIPMQIMPTGSGEFTTRENPVAAAASSEAGKRIQAKANSIEAFNATGRPAAQSVVKLAPFAGPTQAGNVSPNFNENNARLKVAVDRLNAEAERLGLVVGGSQSPGAAGMAGALGGINPMLGAAAGMFTQLMGQKQALSAATPAPVLKQYAYAVQLAAERQKALVAKEYAWALSHNGDTTGFTQSPDYKFIMNAEPFVNPDTGDLVLPLTKSQQKEYVSKDYGPLSVVKF